MASSRNKRRSAEDIAIQMADFSSSSEDSAISDEDSILPKRIEQSKNVNATFSEDEDAENDSSDPLWTSVTSENDKRPDPLPEFLATPGINPSIRLEGTDIKDAMCFVKLFLTDDLLAHIRDCVNSRAWKDAECYMNENEEMPSAIANWRNVSIDEIKKFLGIIFYMGIDKKPKTYDYWSKDLLYHNDLFSMKECLTRARFCEILKYFRVCDYAERSEVDPIGRIRPFVKLCNKICQSVYMPERDVSIDERLMKFKGRSKIRQYIPSKRSRYGIKSYVLCESSSGYVWSFKVHSDSVENRNIVIDLEGADELSCTERLVVYLARDLLNLGYHIYIDNYYMSVRLAEFLLQHLTLVTGTCRPNRGIPTLLKEAHVAVGSCCYVRKKNLLALKVVDRKSSGKKTLIMLDSAHEAAEKEVKVIKKGGTVEKINKSQIILSYNKSMGGVDLLDSGIHHYDCTRKSYYWFVKYALSIIQTMHHNAFVVYRKYNNEMDYLKFIEATVRNFILSTGNVRSRSAVQKSKPSLDVSSSSNHESSTSPAAGHYPSRIPATASRQRPARRCKMCSTDAKRKETVFFCNECSGNPALCAEPCFRNYHLRDFSDL